MNIIVDKMFKGRIVAISRSTILVLFSMAFCILSSSLSAQYIVNFEAEAKAAYASGNVTLNGIEWNMTEALIGNLANDFKNGNKSARIRGRNGASLTMLANKANGLGSISFDYRRYGTDGSQQAWAVEYSTNNGATWIQIGSNFTATATVQTFNQVVNVVGNIRVRIILTTTPGTTGNRRINVDDITLTDFTGAPTPTITLSESTITGLDYVFNNGPSANQSFTASGSNLTANIALSAPANFEISTNASSGFGNSINLAPSSGTVNSTIIYARLIAGLALGSYSGTLTATSTGATQQDINLSGVVGNCAPTNHYRSISSGDWNNASIWESSANGVSGWAISSCPPNFNANTITVSSGHTINITSNLTIDQTIIEKNAILSWNSGTLAINDGNGDDLIIFGTFKHNLNEDAPYAAPSTIRVKSNGVLEVNNNSISASHYGHSPQIFYENRAVFYWNLSTTALFQTSNRTYFPNSAANEIPIFRTNTPNINVGAGSDTRINGIFEVEINNVTWSNGGDKIFRNGIGGAGNINQAASCGRFLMDGDSAFIFGSGAIDLDSGERLQTDGAVYVQLLSDKEINNGQLRITNPATLDAQQYELSGTANIQLNSDATLITKHPNGVNGSLSGLAGIAYETDYRQNIIFERNGPQNAGTTSLNPVLGSVLVRNGSQLTLQQDLSIENKTNGSFVVDGFGSELRAISAVELNINGNRFFTLQNGGSMNDNCLEHLRLITRGNSSTATFTGNGNTIKCWNFTSEKNASGGVVLATNTPLYCKNNFTIDYSPGAATITDNGNSITVGDDVRLKGTTANFDFTGTIEMTCESSGTGQADLEIENGNTTQSIEAELNNLTINSSNPNADIRLQGQTGNGNIVLKNNFTITGIGTGRTVNIYGNTLIIGGNWTNQVGASAFDEGTSTVVFNAAVSQTLTCNGAEGFHNLTKTNTGTLDLQTTINASGNLVLDGGTFNTSTSDNINVTGNLDLQSNSIIALGPAAHQLNFGNSSGLSPWAGSSLEIQNWSGTAGNSGTNGQLFFDSDSSGLSCAQLDKVSFQNFSNPSAADILLSGEVIPRISSLTINNDSLCASEGNNGVVGSTNSVSGINYYLFDANSVQIAGPIAGTGASIQFNGLAPANGYFVKTISGCNRSNSANVVAIPNPSTGSILYSP